MGVPKDDNGVPYVALPYPKDTTTGAPIMVSPTDSVVPAAKLFYSVWTANQTYSTSYVTVWSLSPANPITLHEIVFVTDESDTEIKITIDGETSLKLDMGSLDAKVGSWEGVFSIFAYAPKKWCIRPPIGFYVESSVTIEIKRTDMAGNKTMYFGMSSWSKRA